MLLEHPHSGDSSGDLLPLEALPSPLWPTAASGQWVLTTREPRELEQEHCLLEARCHCEVCVGCVMCDVCECVRCEVCVQ